MGHSHQVKLVVSLASESGALLCALLCMWCHAVHAAWHPAWPPGQAYNAGALCLTYMPFPYTA